MTFWCRRVYPMAVSVILIVITCATFEVTSAKGREEPHSYTIDELLSSHYEHKHSDDIGMDPCKAGPHRGARSLPYVKGDYAIVNHAGQVRVG
ncbi:hypothetical protein RR46_02876 [Papilio xuthus]|uniref:Uncharacterized protein n=1 Tax=Papilio xuthus TaxID=66420 RepID=A0A194QC03_PAPXU|nr:hypothetical protein RR46_02876 [Papilio xuthus]